MPKTVTLDDGTEEEVYTKEELEGYQKGAEKNKERKEVLSKLNETLGLDADDDIIKTASELRSSNFGKYKAKHKAMEKQLKEKGVEIDDDGNIISGDQKMTSEQVQELVNKEVNNKLNGTARENALASFDGEEKKLVEHYLDKLMPTGGTLEENLELAVIKAFPDRDTNDIKLSISGNGGGRPAAYTGDKKKSFTETDKGLAMLNQTCPAGYEVKIVDGKHKMVKKA